MYKLIRNRATHTIVIENMATKEKFQAMFFGDHWSVNEKSLNEKVSFRWTRLLPSFHGQGTMYVDQGLMDYLLGGDPIHLKEEVSLV